MTATRSDLSRPVYHSVVKRLRAPLSAAVLLAALSIAQPTTAGAQPPAPIAGAAATTTAAEAAAPQDPRALAQQAQADFERVRRLNLPRYRGKVPTGRACPEPVGLN